MSAAGRKRYIALNTGTYASPVWTELKRITELEKPNSRSVGERKYRGSDDVKGVTGYRNRKITFKYAVKRGGSTDAVYDALKQAYDNDTVVDIQILNLAPTYPTGNANIGKTYNGTRGPYLITKFDEPEPDEEGVTTDIELVIADEDLPTTPGTVWDVVAVTGTVAAAS